MSYALPVPGQDYPDLDFEGDGGVEGEEVLLLLDVDLLQPLYIPAPVTYPPF